MDNSEIKPFISYNDVLYKLLITTSHLTIDRYLSYIKDVHVRIKLITDIKMAKHNNGIVIRDNNRHVVVEPKNPENLDYIVDKLRESYTY